MDLSIVIVNYKTPELTRDCVASIHEHTTGLDFEIIIVDNQSEDNSKELILGEFSSTKWVDMGDNAGTSRGYNAGVRNSIGDYVLILNSDTVIRDNALKASLDEHRELEKTEKVGLYSCQLKGFDDIIQYNSNISFPSLKKYLYNNSIAIKLGKKDPHKLSENEKLELHQKFHETCWIGIAFGIINAKIFREEGLYFDEDIFMYSDEVEWCLRLKEFGYKHYFSADATIYHVNSGSSVFSEWRFGQITLSEWMYFMKVKGKLGYIFMISSILINHIIDFLFSFKSKLLGKKEIESEVEAKIRRGQEWELIRKYFFVILLKYKAFPSSGKSYLKYLYNPNK